MRTVFLSGDKQRCDEVARAADGRQAAATLEGFGASAPSLSLLPADAVRPIEASVQRGAP